MIEDAGFGFVVVHQSFSMFFGRGHISVKYEHTDMIHIFLDSA